MDLLVVGHVTGDEVDGAARVAPDGRVEPALAGAGERVCRPGLDLAVISELDHPDAEVARAQLKPGGTARSRVDGRAAWSAAWKPSAIPSAPPPLSRPSRKRS